MAVQHAAFGREIWALMLRIIIVSIVVTPNKFSVQLKGYLWQVIVIMQRR